MKLSTRDLTLLAIVGLVVVLGGLWWFVVKPANAETSAQRDQLAEIQTESNALRDTVARLQSSATSESRRTAERLRLSKALPGSVQAPGAMVQLQRLADRANVELTSIKTTQHTDFGSIRGTEFEVKVTGRFFDVDDFLYRLHRQVEVDERDRPVIGGRLFATTSVDMTLDQGAAESGGPIEDDDEVVATLKVLAFSSAPAGAAAATPSPAGTPVAAPSTATSPGATPAPAPSSGVGGSSEPATAPPATTTGPAPATTAPAGATPPADGSSPGAPQPTATPSSGGAQ
jgi:hypothetical protein